MELDESPAVRAIDLYRSFDGVRAVHGVSFDVAAGEVFGLVGPDGAGKTTTLRMLAGVLRPDRGQAEVRGIDVVAEAERAKLELSYMPQRFGLYEDLSVAENIHFYADLFGISRRERIARESELLAAADMARFRRRLAGKLSGGMKQKLGLICALIHTPKVLLLDEPTTGVDPVSRREFWAILYRLRESGVAIVMATAYMDEAERCSRLALFEAGRIRRSDTPARLKTMMPGALLVLRAARLAALRERLADQSGVLGILVMGDSVHVRVDDAERRCGQLRAALGDLDGVRIDVAEPSIEDVFVALTEGGGT